MPERTETRRAASSRRRRTLYQGRLAASAEPRKRLNALVGWWMAEWHRLTEADQQVEFERLRLIAADLNTKAGM